MARGSATLRSVTRGHTTCTQAYVNFGHRIQKHVLKSPTQIKKRWVITRRTRANASERWRTVANVFNWYGQIVSARRASGFDRLTVTENTVRVARKWDIRAVARTTSAADITRWE